MTLTKPSITWMTIIRFGTAIRTIFITRTVNIAFVMLNPTLSVTRSISTAFVQAFINNCIANVLTSDFIVRVPRTNLANSNIMIRVRLTCIQDWLRDQVRFHSNLKKRNFNHKTLNILIPFIWFSASDNRTETSICHWVIWMKNIRKSYFKYSKSSLIWIFKLLASRFPTSPHCRPKIGLVALN